MVEKQAANKQKTSTDGGSRVKRHWARFLVPIVPLVAIGLLIPSISNAAQPPVGLGTASTYAILAGSAITNTGPTTLAGSAGSDIGLAPGTAFTGSGSVSTSGATHLADTQATTAKADLLTAYNDAAGRTPVTTIATELSGTPITPGVYNSASGTFGLTGNLTLDAQNDPSAVFVFQSTTTLITATDSTVTLLNGAQACNVYWQVGSSATFGTNSSFVGHVLANTSITANTGASFQGQLLASDGAITLDSISITNANCAAVLPSSTPSDSASVLPSVTPSDTPSVTPSVTPSSTASTTPSATPSASASASATATPSASASATASSTPSASATETTVPSATPTATTSNGGTLPNTETPWALLLLIGASLVFVGSLVWAFRKPRV